MRLTRQSEIAIGILAGCARRAGTPVHTDVVAREIGTTKSHAAKIVHILVQAGFLTTLRGRYGGLMLTQSAEKTTIGAVLRHTQPDLAEISAPIPRGRGIQLHLDVIGRSARAMILSLMDRFTIADLMAERAIYRLACSDCSLMRSARGMTSAAPSETRKKAEVHATNIDY